MRRMKWIVAALALAVSGTAVWIWFGPAPDATAAPAESMLDAAMPQYHLRAEAERRICAAPEAIDRAIRELKAEEVEGFDWIVSIRRRRGQAVGAALREPMFQALRRANVIPVADVPREELVLGMAGPFWTLHGPRGAEAAEVRKSMRAVEGDPLKFASLEFPASAKAAMNVRISIQLGDSCPLVSSELRLYCPRPADLQALIRLWRIAAPARMYLHQSYLAAVAKRATQP